MLIWPDIENFVINGNPQSEKRVEKTADEWRKLLPDEVFEVTRLAGTERPFSSPMCTHFEPGIYACACCNTLLFDSFEKFDSGTGWPSFTQPLGQEVGQHNVAYFSDESISRQRVEITCNSCDAHLGHVFPDGPPPSNLRYCVNALSLTRQT